MLKWLEKIVTVEAHRVVVYGTVSEFFFILFYFFICWWIASQTQSSVKWVVLTDSVVSRGLYGLYRVKEQST